MFPGMGLYLLTHVVLLFAVVARSSFRCRYIIKSILLWLLTFPGFHGRDWEMWWKFDFGIRLRTYLSCLRRAKAAKNSWKIMLPNPESSCHNPSTVAIPRQCLSLHSDISLGNFLEHLKFPLLILILNPRLWIKWSLSHVSSTRPRVNCYHVLLWVFSFPKKLLPTLSSWDVWRHFTSWSLTLEAVYLFISTLRFVKWA